MSVIWVVMLILGITLINDVSADTFNLDGYTLLDSLLYLPKPGDEVMIEHLGDTSKLIDLYRPIVPAIVLLLAASALKALKRIPISKLPISVLGQGSESNHKPAKFVYPSKHKTSDLLFTLLFFARSLSIPILLLLTTLRPGSLLDSSISSFLLNYNLVVTPSLVTSALHPIIMIMAQSDLCSTQNILDQVDEMTDRMNLPDFPDLPDLEIPDSLDNKVIQPPEETGIKTQGRDTKESDGRNRRLLPVIDKSAAKTESEIPALNTSTPENSEHELVEDPDPKMKLQLPGFLNFGKAGERRDEKKVAALIEASQAKADRRRNDVVNMLRAKQRERENILANARRELKSRIGSKNLPDISVDEGDKRKAEKMCSSKPRNDNEHGTTKDTENKAKGKQKEERIRKKELKDGDKIINKNESKEKDKEKGELTKEDDRKLKTCDKKSRKNKGDGKDKTKKDEDQPIYTKVKKR